MPLIDVRHTDRFRYHADLITPDDWWSVFGARQVSAGELERIKALTASGEELQELLAEVYGRPEVELNGPEDVTEVTGE